MALGFVRPARPEDAGEIARLQLTTWRTAYRRMFPAHVLANVDEGYLERGWREAITETPSPRHRVLIAVEQSETANTVVGFAAAGPADEQALAPEEPPLGADVAAITDLLVEPRWGRRGHGSRLLAATVDLWREDAFTSAVAWAYDADQAMQKFLTSTGWGPDGATRALDVDDMLVNQLRLHVALDPQLGPQLDPQLGPQLDPRLDPQLGPQLDPPLCPPPDPQLDPPLGLQ
jgi:GNAT superfamily N-acetyltransferase